MKPWSLAQSLGPNTVAVTMSRLRPKTNRVRKLQEVANRGNNVCQMRAPCIAKSCSDEQVA